MTHRYMLDSNICIYAINNHPTQVKAKLISIGEGQCAISSIVASELAFGVVKSGRTNNKANLTRFLSLFDIVPFDASSMWHYANLRHDLQAKGTVIGALDMLIAAHALALDATLVTNNTKEFERIPHLKVENWI